MDVVYAFGRTADQIRPYLVAGVGLYNYRLSTPRFTPTSETKVGFGVAPVWHTRWAGGARASSWRARSPT